MTKGTIDDRIDKRPYRSTGKECYTRTPGMSRFLLKQIFSRRKNGPKR